MGFNSGLKGLRYYFRILPGRTEENHKNPVSMPDVGAEIQTGKLANVRIECCCLNESALCGQGNEHLWAP